MLKKAVFVGLALLVMMTGALLACARATPTPAPTPAPAAAPTPAPTPVQVITLKMNTWGAPRAFTQGGEWWMDQVEERTGGQVKFERYFNEALGGSRLQIDNIKTGLFDLGPVAPGYAPGKTPLSMVSSLPGLTHDFVALGKAMADVAELPAMVEELKEWNAKFLYGWVVPSYEYMGKKPVYKVEDFQGLRVRAYGEQAKFADKLGMVVTAMPAPEIFEALERGTLDGALFPWSYAFGAYGLHEASKYATLLGVGALTALFCINLDTWNRLSPDVQRVMLEVAKEVPDKYAEIYAEADKKWIPIFKEKGIEIYDFPPEERAKVKAIAGKPLWDAWAEEMEGKGLAGRQVMDAMLAAIEKYSK